MQRSGRAFILVSVLLNVQKVKLYASVIFLKRNVEDIFSDLC